MQLCGADSIFPLPLTVWSSGLNLTNKRLTLARRSPAKTRRMAVKSAVVGMGARKRTQSSYNAVAKSLHARPQEADDRCRIRTSKDRASSNDHIGTGRGCLVDGGRSQTAVHLDVLCGILCTHLSDLPHYNTEQEQNHLWHHVSHELLCAETGLHRHHQDHVHSNSIRDDK